MKKIFSGFQTAFLLSAVSPNEQFHCCTAGRILSTVIYIIEREYQLEVREKRMGIPRISGILHIKFSGNSLFSAGQKRKKVFTVTEDL